MIDVPYTEVAPPADLAPYVDRFWFRTRRRGDPSSLHRVLPDGCVDVIVSADRGTARFVGTMTRALVVADRPGAVIAVRFKPGTAAAVARCALDALTDRDVELADLGLSGDLGARIADVHGIADRLGVLQAWLRARLAGVGPPDPRIAHAVQRLAGGARVEQVVAELAVSRQHLARAFRRDVGIAPKMLARIARMQRAASALHRDAGGLHRDAGGLHRDPGGPGGLGSGVRDPGVRGAGARGPGARGLAGLAVELGYFDQAHFANDVRALTGLSPKEIAAAPPVALVHLYGG